MFSPDTYRWLADAVLTLHLGVVLFIVAGLAAVFVGAWRGWRWVRGWPFRLLHLGAIVYVAGQSWLGVSCPLTLLESWLRVRGLQDAYGQRGFIEDWLQRLLYWQAPAWVFLVLYTAFAAVVVLAWLLVPPGRPGRQPRIESTSTSTST